MSAIPTGQFMCCSDEVLLLLASYDRPRRDDARREVASQKHSFPPRSEHINLPTVSQRELNVK
jgi:hypothetical protein